MSLGAALALLAAALLLAGLGLSLLGLRALLAQRPLRAWVISARPHGQNIVLRLARPWPLPRYQAGQALALGHPQGAWRRYSLAARWRNPFVYELAIKREPGGLVSNWAADLKPGQRLRLKAPAGDFLLPPRQAGEWLLLAGGIGITPLRAMLQHWWAGPRRAPLTLVWSVRSLADLLDYHAKFEALAAREPRLRYIPLLTGDAPDWRGERGRVTATRLRAWQQTDQPAGLWMCASTALMQSLRAQLLEQGWDAERIHFEAFGAGANADGARYQVRLGEQELSFQGQPSLLAALQQAGVAVDSDCRNGSCGACVLRLQSGQLRQTLVPECRLAPGQLLACCCVPASDLVLLR